ncbi:NAD(P)-binding protein [Micromonospora endophytica]|uniref:NADH:flavin oxidoreductase n=1 Tax=Micromonospora endophytica TaxID=515350 RepID=A0A2W2CHH5_9ACTN|nr:NAD(P)-binding protein [Micromonospora endophytica]PZF98881.1 NADH:flavin oxidoreductase [Micromonospora endophytica]RIW44382.1 FAD-dependent oxidoreductase [Micromonospora endophytica]BCJ62417.1 oxidoreductase [Micromonospora endophytica]
MANDGQLRSLLTPVLLGPVQLRNRVFVPGHTTNFGHRNEPTARLAAYHAERARGGVGLIITEAIRVHPTSAGRSISLGSFSDQVIPAYRAVTDAVHEHGARIFAQLMHAGRQANGDATRTAAWSSSPVPWAAGAHVPHAMGRQDIAVVVQAFAAAARRMHRAGFDGLEVHAGHGHLLQQFLSPHTNQRTDGYGGSLDNRLRLTREVLGAVRSATDLPIGLRVSADEFLPGGLDPDAVVEIVARLRADFPLSYVHVSHSAYHGSYSLATQMADMSFGHAPFRHHAARFKREFPDLPVLAVCRLDSLPEAAELIAAGEADLVGLARPHIADPHLVVKAVEGRQHEVRSCLACNQGCIGRLETSLPISCVVNPEVGAEREWRTAWDELDRSPGRRRVLVVGGGPAGLAAAVAARRAGHHVDLAEAGAALGGQLAIAAQVPGRERLDLLTRDLATQVHAAGVEVRLGWRPGVGEVLDGGYHDVVVATGSRPARRSLPGGPPVLDLWQAVTRLVAPPEAAQLAGTFVVIDDEGTWAAASVAEGIARRGGKVHLVSPTAGIAARITTYSRLALLKRLADLRVVAHPLRTVHPADATTVLLTGPLADADATIADVTAVIDAGAAVAVDDLFRDLDARIEGPTVHLVGDANAPRTALEAVYEGHLAGAFLGRHDTAAAELVSHAH